MNYQEFIDKYYIDRHNTHSVKWDSIVSKYGRNDLLPMFVADMDFRCDENITKGLADIINYGVYAYSYIEDDYYKEMINFNKRHHDITYQKEWIRFADGAVDAIYNVINAFTKKGDSIMLNSPIYPQFFNAINNSERRLVDVPLINNDGYFSLDFDAIRTSIIKEDVKLLIFCSPHNPTGRVWQKEELIKLLDICHKHNVLLLSDEVHEDLVINGKHLPILSFDKYQDILISINACAKTFNLAMFKMAHVIIKDSNLLATYDRYIKNHHKESFNYLSLNAYYNAYKYGDNWLNMCLDVIRHNYELCKTYLDNMHIEYTKIEGTYLIFINIEKFLDNISIEDFMINKIGVVPNFGSTFSKDFNTWIRINLATSHDNVETFLRNLLNENNHLTRKEN